MQTTYNEMFYYAQLYFNAGVFSKKSQIINIFRLLDYIVFVVALQLCHYSMKAAIDNI